MATHTGSEGTIKIGSDTVGEIRSYSISETADTIEDTSMGDASRTYKTGLKSFTASVDVFWDENDAGQTALAIGSTVTLNVYPEGASTGDKYFTGSAIVTGLTVNGSFDGMVEASLTLQGTGALSLSTAS
jgi:predicted secreted protein